MVSRLLEGLRVGVAGGHKQRQMSVQVHFVIAAVSKSSETAESMASHIYGCRIIQRLLENCPLDRLDGILDPIVSAVGKLSKDKHANYVIQCILEKGRFEDKRSIVKAISKNVLDFSKNKAGFGKHNLYRTTFSYGSLARFDKAYSYSSSGLECARDGAKLHHNVGSSRNAIHVDFTCILVRTLPSDSPAAGLKQRGREVPRSDLRWARGRKPGGGRWSIL